MLPRSRSNFSPSFDRYRRWARAEVTKIVLAVSLSDRASYTKLLPLARNQGGKAGTVDCAYINRRLFILCHILTLGEGRSFE